MATTSTPAWSAPRSGLLGDTGAVDHAAQVNQLLGAHASNEVYQGSSILTPNGAGGTAWAYPLATQDIAQPFTMSGTVIGRVVVPLLPVGNGCDLTVSLYTNNSGAPGTLVNSTRIPANWITQFAAVSAVAGPSSALPTTQYTNNPLAVGQFNSFHLGAVTSFSTNYATTNGASTCVIGSYSVWTGGTSSLGSFPTVASVFSIGFDGAGNVGSFVPQPALPVALNAHAQTFSLESNGTYSVIVAGGSTATPPTVTPVATVYVAPFDANTGGISAWSTQTALPVAVVNAMAASFGPYVYVLGGSNGSSNLNTVYWAQVQNGQITSWNTGPALPFTPSAGSPFAGVVDGMLFVFNVSQTAYAPLAANGTPGAWQTGPTLASGVAPGQDSPGALALGAYGLVAAGSGGSATPQFLGTSVNGPDIQWSQNGGVQNSEAQAVFSNGNGTWQFYGFLGTGTGPVALTPRISVPLPTTGLTNSTTYHIVLSQPNGDLNDYLRTHDDFNVFSGDPTMLTRARGSATWVAGTTGHAVPIQIYDQTTTIPGTPGGQPWHTWEDSGARISTLVYATTPDRRLIGIADAVAQPGLPLNMNPTFTAGTAPWVAHGGAVAQSSAFTQGQLPFSARVTPTGGTAAYIESEQVSAQLGHTYTVTAWLYSAGGFTGAAVNINWYSGGTFNSTTSGTGVTLAAGTWTQVTVSGSVPNVATPTATVVCVENGTPTSGNVFYVSAATLQDQSGPMLSTVSEVLWPGTWPGTTYPPTGLTQLA